MANWGPSTCSCGPGAIQADDLRCVLFDSGQVAGGFIGNVSGTVTQTFTGGRPDAAWAVHVESYTSTGAFIDDQMPALGRVSQAQLTFSFTPNALTSRVIVKGAISAYVGQSITFTGSGTYASDVYCALGTRAKPGVEGVVTLTPDLVLSILSAENFVWVGIQFFASILWQTIVVDNLCKGLPAQMPPLNLSSWNYSAATIMQVFQAIAWRSFCECVPGTPNPVPPPPPTATQPPSWPSPPNFTCDGADICATLVKIQQQLAAVAATQAATLELVTLVQRYDTPFAYIRGATHSNLSTEGVFAVPRIIGLELAVTSRGQKRLALGNPDYVYDLGWAALADGNGMIEEMRFTRDHQLWLPRHASDATRFQWAVQPDVVFSATELYAEP